MFSILFRSRTIRLTARIAALLALGLLALDLGDVRCDPLLPALASAVTTPAAGQADPCSDICVDDCFCCSSSVPAIRPVPISQPAAAERVEPLPGGESSPGFALPPDHVPLATN